MIKYLLLGIIFLVSSFALRAQESADNLEVIYSGLDNPTSIYATQDYLFVVESGKHRVLKLDHNGKLIETLGGLGSGDYQFDTPIDIDATNGLKIYVSDYRNNRVQIFDRRFQFLSTIKAAQGQRSFRPTQLVVNDFGELFVYDESSKSIYRYDENGSYRTSFTLHSKIKVVSDLMIHPGLIDVIDRVNLDVFSFRESGLIYRQYLYYPPFNLDTEVVSITDVNNTFFLLDKERIFRYQ